MMVEEHIEVLVVCLTAKEIRFVLLANRFRRRWLCLGLRLGRWFLRWLVRSSGSP